jgi:hypothetical protein
MLARLSFLTLCLVAACSDDAQPAGANDAGQSTDSTTSTGDASPDTGSDSSTTDAGVDAPADAPPFDAPADAPERCVEYCSCMQQRCPNLMPANCISACSNPNTWNIACRIDHCKLAQGDPVQHCPHAAGQNTCL